MFFLVWQHACASPAAPKQINRKFDYYRLNPMPLVRHISLRRLQLVIGRVSAYWKLSKPLLFLVTTRKVRVIEGCSVVAADLTSFSMLFT